MLLFGKFRVYPFKSNSNVLGEEYQISIYLFLMFSKTLQKKHCYSHKLHESKSDTNLPKTNLWISVALPFKNALKLNTIHINLITFYKIRQVLKILLLPKYGLLWHIS